MPPWPEEKPVATLKSALNAFLKANGLQGAGKHLQLESAWGRIVGPELVRRTRVLGFRKGIVEIGVESSALMNEIRFHRSALLDGPAARGPAARDHRNFFLFGADTGKR